ncbi:branched-chain amino acid ABC transporter permease [Streptomyces neyagawaensis]|uniref:branched-chain amino acid ABC transporter permease n=1 Tax=Streptomyces neyagawaensis TaxID=42238 RepID=UPI0006E29172|nr:branched-chain amino acid ABC transporter permease [Streptomyces neyagawaensis]MCL6737473.1 branched-chain amino acid ABC transporter permease [Streptomyces neyagawaensis]MDE1688242.1 branched-chain amino acid ABC transporter permease [Streptomyces neyagawaensis]
MVQLIAAGLAPGSAYAIIGCCVVLLFRTTGVLNFSQAVLGAFGAYTAAEAYGALGLTSASAALVGLLTGTLLSALVGGLITWLFKDGQAAARATAMIAVTVGLLTLGLRLFGDVPLSVPAVVPATTVDTGNVTVGLDTVVVLGLGLVLAGGSAAVLARTRLGAVLRAVSARPSTAELLGVRVRLLALGMWAFTGAMSSAAMLLIAPARSDNFGNLGLIILPALAAVLVGAFRSVMATLAGGLVLGIVESVSVSWPAVSDYKAVLPFLLVIVALLWSQRKQVWDEAR